MSQKLVQTTYMSADDFAVVAATFKRMAPRNIALVRKILVEGRTMAEVAREHEVTLQRAKEQRDFFLMAHNKMLRFQPEWITVQVTAPTEDIKAFLADIETKHRVWAKQHT